MEILKYSGGGERVGVILFIQRIVSKDKIQLLPSKVCAILYLSKDKAANPYHLKCTFHNIIANKKVLKNFLIFRR